MGFNTIRRIIPWDFPGTAKSILLWLAYHHNDSTGRCDPSINLLAQESGFNLRTVKRSIAKLATAQAITIRRRNGCRNSYIIHDPCQPDTGVMASPVPTNSQPVPSTTATSVRLAPEQEEQEEQEWQRPENYSPGLDDVALDIANPVGPLFTLKNGAHWRICKGFQKTLSEAFPGVDIGQELKKAAAWCIANPRRQKAQRGMPAFLNRWMGQAIPSITAGGDNFHDQCNEAALAMCRTARPPKAAP